LLPAGLDFVISSPLKIVPRPSSGLIKVLKKTLHPQT